MENRHCNVVRNGEEKIKECNPAMFGPAKGKSGGFDWERRRKKRQNFFMVMETVLNSD